METNKIYCGDVLDILDQVPDKFVNCIVTSPPYFALRDYSVEPTEWPDIIFTPMAGLPDVEIPAMTCCLGLEPDPISFTAHLVYIFRKCYRALKDDGTLWLNLGDSYISPGKNRTEAQASENSTLEGGLSTQLQALKQPAKKAAGLKQKDLIGIPWRVAFALQADGWYLRSDIIWAKPNPMPESVTDRPTKAHEYLFLLSKSPRYFYDADAIREDDLGTDHVRTILD